MSRRKCDRPRQAPLKVVTLRQLADPVTRATIREWLSRVPARNPVLEHGGGYVKKDV